MSIDLDHKLSVLAAAEEVPDAVAVRSNGDCLTYRELAKKVRDILPRLGDARPYPLVARPDLETLIKVFALIRVLPSTNAIRSSQVLKDWIIICRKIRLSSCLLPELRDCLSPRSLPEKH